MPHKTQVTVAGAGTGAGGGNRILERLEAAGWVTRRLPGVCHRFMEKQFQGEKKRSGSRRLIQSLDQES